MTTTLLVIAMLSLVGYLLYRLMRWARGRTRGAQVLGAVFSEVTQGAAVYEAKQGNKREEGDTGDPPKHE